MGESMEVANERVERFELGEGVAIDVTTVSGDLRLVEGATGTVRLTTDDPEPAARLALVECRYDAGENRLVVDTKVAKGLGARDRGRGLSSAIRGIIQHVKNDVDVEIAVPSGASVRLRTASGELVAEAPLAALEMQSASGDVRAGRVDGALKVQTASGDLEVDEARGPVTAKSASGDVRIGSLAGELSVQCASGDVVATVAAPSHVDVANVSGDVTIAVTPGLLVELDVRSVSGQLTSQIALDGASGEVGEEPVTVRVRSVSGDVTVRRA